MEGSEKIFHISSQQSDMKNFHISSQDQPNHKNSMISSQEREVVTLLEPGLYRMLARTSSPIAEPFQDWLFEEVLPAIRKTGGYGQTLANPDRAIAAAKQETLIDAANTLADPLLLVDPLQHYVYGVRLIAASIVKEFGDFGAKPIVKTQNVFVVNSGLTLPDYQVQLGSFTINELFELLSVLCWMKDELPTVRSFGRSSIELFPKSGKQYKMTLFNDEQVEVKQPPVRTLREIAEGKHDQTIAAKIEQQGFDRPFKFDGVRGVQASPRIEALAVA